MHSYPLPLLLSLSDACSQVGGGASRACSLSLCSGMAVAACGVMVVTWGATIGACNMVVGPLLLLLQHGAWDGVAPSPLHPLHWCYTWDGGRGSWHGSWAPPPPAWHGLRPCPSSPLVLHMGWRQGLTTGTLPPSPLVMT